MLALQVYSKDFDSDFFKLPEQVQARIERQIDRLGARLSTFPHQRLKGLGAYKLRIGNYRVIYDFSADRGQLFLLAVGHRREVYRTF
jgi:mRNA interferase RelE/StbE